MYRLRLICLSVVLTSGVQAEHPTPLEKGKQLHSEQCVSCHIAEVYTRKERKVTHRAGLESQVETCAVNLNLAWFDDDIDSVVHYLNKTYYHFTKMSVTEPTQKEK